MQRLCLKHPVQIASYFMQLLPVSQSVSTMFLEEDPYRSEGLPRSQTCHPGRIGQIGSMIPWCTGTIFIGRRAEKKDLLPFCEEEGVAGLRGVLL